MKEATGELNATVVVVMAVSILIAFFYYTIWPMISSNFNKNSNCSKAICEQCNKPNDDCEVVKCYLKDKPSEKFECVYKG